MRVLHVAESIKGGCGTYLDQIVPAQLQQPGIAAVRVIVPDAHAAQVPAIPPADLVRFSAGHRSVAGLAALARTVRREVASFRPDVVHLHSTFAGLVARPLLHVGRRRPRIVYCAHGWAFDMDRAGWKLTAMAAAERALAPLADAIVAISDYERGRGIDAGIAPRRITTVHNGLADAPSASPPAPGGRLRLLFVGRLDRQKGCDTLFDAAEPLGDRVELRVAGASVVGDEAARALPGNATALGWQGAEQIAEQLAWCDLVVVPSRWEGFGLVALEAMRAGRAVVASRVGGLPEVVEDGATGILVPPGDAGALRAALLAPDAARIAAMGAAGRRRFEQRFGIGRTADGLLAVYRSVLAGRAA